MYTKLPPWSSTVPPTLFVLSAALASCEMSFGPSAGAAVLKVAVAAWAAPLKLRAQATARGVRCERVFIRGFNFCFMSGINCCVLGLLRSAAAKVLVDEYQQSSGLHQFGRWAG